MLANGRESEGGLKVRKVGEIRGRIYILSISIGIWLYFLRSYRVTVAFTRESRTD